MALSFGFSVPCWLPTSTVIPGHRLAVHEALEAQLAAPLADVRIVERHDLGGEAERRRHRRASAARPPGRPPSRSWSSARVAATSICPSFFRRARMSVIPSSFRYSLKSFAVRESSRGMVETPTHVGARRSSARARSAWSSARSIVPVPGAGVRDAGGVEHDERLHALPLDPVLALREGPVQDRAREACRRGPGSTGPA